MNSEAITIIAILGFILFMFWWAVVAGKRRTLEHQMTLLDAFPLGCVGLAPDSRILHWNSNMETLSGLTAKTVLNKPLTQLPEPWGTHLNRINTENTLASIDVDHGPQAWTLHRARLSRDEQMPTVLLVEDRTESKQLAHRVAHQDRLASLGQLAAGVAHEIGNPLTGIDSLAQLLPASEKENARLIREQTQRINRIIRSLLKFSREGETQLTKHPFESTDLINDSIRLFELDPAYSDYSIFLRRIIKRQCHGDPVAVSQVLINLFKNAAQASEAHQTIYLDCFENGKSQLQIDVEDRGHGIDPDLLPRIFEPFVSGHLDQGGTGLGLAICYGIVQQHDGQIHAYSPTKQGGTRMTITLPIYNPD